MKLDGWMNGWVRKGDISLSSDSGCCFVYLSTRLLFTRCVEAITDWRVNRAKCDTLDSSFPPLSSPFTSQSLRVSVFVDVDAGVWFVCGTVQQLTNSLGAPCSSPCLLKALGL